MLQAALVEGDGLVVVAGQVVGVAELEQGAGVAGVELDGPLQVLDRGQALALGEVAARQLEVILGVVAGEIAASLARMARAWARSPFCR